MGRSRRRLKNQRTIAGEVLATRTHTPGEEEEKPVKSASATPIFDALMAEKFTGHYLIQE